MDGNNQRGVVVVPPVRSSAIVTISIAAVFGMVVFIMLAVLFAKPMETLPRTADELFGFRG